MRWGQWCDNVRVLWYEGAMVEGCDNVRGCNGVIM